MGEVQSPGLPLFGGEAWPQVLCIASAYTQAQQARQTRNTPQATSTQATRSTHNRTTNHDQRQSNTLIREHCTPGCHRCSPPGSTPSNLQIHCSEDQSRISQGDRRNASAGPCPIRPQVRLAPHRPQATAARTRLRSGISYREDTPVFHLLLRPAGFARPAPTEGTVHVHHRGGTLLAPHAHSPVPVRPTAQPKRVPWRIRGVGELGCFRLR